MQTNLVFVQTNVYPPSLSLVVGLHYDESTFSRNYTPRYLASHSMLPFFLSTRVCLDLCSIRTRVRVRLSFFSLLVFLSYTSSMQRGILADCFTY
jgi:hypothetical protein